jgi:uncharacterized protein YbaR (Trm112 family)
MRAEIISILRCPQTGEELRLFLIKDYKNGQNNNSENKLTIIKKHCVNNQLSKVLYNSSLTFIYPIIDEIPMLDPSKAIPIGSNT